MRWELYTIFQTSFTAFKCNSNKIKAETHVTNGNYNEFLILVLCVQGITLVKDFSHFSLDQTINFFAILQILLAPLWWLMNLRRNSCRNNENNPKILTKFDTCTNAYKYTRTRRHTYSLFHFPTLPRQQLPLKTDN